MSNMITRSHSKRPMEKSISPRSTHRPKPLKKLKSEHNVENEQEKTPTKKETEKQEEKPSHKKHSEEKWSNRVTTTSDALDLEQGVFTFQDPKRIAKSLMDSAETSKRRKTTPFRSAMSMLNFYINRAGKKLDPKQRLILEQSKHELRKLYGREE